MAISTPSVAPTGVVVVDGAEVEARPSQHRNTALRIVEFHDPRDGRLIKTTYGRYQRTNHSSPRHRHTFDQLRFVVSGRVKYGPLILEDGDCAYFPEGVFYGPQELLSDEIVNITIQTQGPSWSAFPSEAQVAAATAELLQHGTMDRATGRYHRPDGRMQDGFEAILEQVTGQKVAYPAPRYVTPTLLRSSRFEWVPSRRDPGVDVKPLGIFNATGPGIKLVRLPAGATLAGGRAPHHQMWIVVSGRVRCGDRSAGEGAYLYGPPNADRCAIVGEADAVLLVASLATQDQPILGAWAE